MESNETDILSCYNPYIITHPQRTVSRYEMHDVSDHLSLKKKYRVYLQYASDYNKYTNESLPSL
jgi:hypothetical protein